MGHGGIRWGLTVCEIIFFGVFVVWGGRCWSGEAASPRPLGDKTVAAFYEHGIFDPHQISEDDLYASIQAAYNQATEPDALRTLGERLLTLKWWRLWDANFEMPPETVIVTDPLPRYCRPSEHWQWTPHPLPPVRGKSPPRLHFSTSDTGPVRHRLHGVFPYILPVNGTLIQEVYVPEGRLPDQIFLRLETTHLASAQQSPKFVQARWTRLPEQHVATENRPQNFWAGTFPASSSKSVSGGRWYRLTVNLVDIGLCGRHRSIHGIEYGVDGGQAWFGRTMIRRPPVEVRGQQPYHVFAEGDELAFDIAVHNVSSAQQRYTLELLVSDYSGAKLLSAEYPLDIPGNSTHHETLVLTPGTWRYVVFEYSLKQRGQSVYHGYSAATVIVPNRTGRTSDAKFGMMYWDQPGQDMVELYEKLGVKFVVLFPEVERLHLFDSRTFEVMPMFWTLPELKPQEGEQLRRKVQPYLEAGQRIFSNFWETDLRVPAEIFAQNMHAFTQILKKFEPAAVVGIGGLAWFNVAYLQRLLQSVQDAASWFDFLAVMLYNTPAPPEYSGIDQETDALANVLEQHDKAEVELWNVEWSYFENLNLDSGYWLNTGVPRSLIAPYTIRHHLLGFAAGITRMVPGTNLYVGRTPLAKNYGHSMTLGRSSVTRYDLMPLPLLPAYSVMTRMLEGKRYVRSLRPSANVICQIYRAHDDRYAALASSQTVAVVWSLFGNETLTLRLRQYDEHSPSTITILNMLGEETTQWTHDGEFHLSVTPEPSYLLLDEGMDIIDISLAEPMLTAIPDKIEVRPGTASLLTLTYHLYNPGWKAVIGSLRLAQPNWLTIVSQEIRYLSDTGEAVAAHRFSPETGQFSEARDTDEIWVGRYHRVEVTYEIALPATIPRTTYYEQRDITQRADFQIEAAFLAGQKVLATTRTPVHILPPLTVRLRPSLHTKADVNTPALQVQLRNNSTLVREGTVRLKIPAQLESDPPEASFTLQPGETRRYSFHLHSSPLGQVQPYTRETVDTQLQRRTEEVAADQPLQIDQYHKNSGYLFSFGVGEGYVIEAVVSDQTGFTTRQSRGFAFRPAVRAKAPLVIDGHLTDWTGAAPLFIPPEGRLSGLTFWASDYGEEMQWRGLDDFSAAWQMMWDEAYLYLAVRVFDDQVVPQHDLGSFWNGDTLSLQIDPLPALTDASVLPQPRDLRQIHTFDIGLNEAGPTIRRKYPALSMPSGSVEQARIAIRQDAKSLLYEIALPWEVLAPLSPERGAWIGVSLVVSEDDGDGRETRCNWFGGVGGNGLAREPRLMGDVHLVP
ncbi:hypothetical protein GF339_14035 [candidate division KSB3 bacterium]|uniref:Carbohydrate-binding domain-containing protein n=1 Tax=candidate division KSB3 bacterium TaxID=2044937 RepID=A0A9D5JXD1_9BACT|nr:hypothetical protein [candidate division KSB3 bacterium]MBD3325701.1 hypothetical protein [candidate division KSB3 bacterium]